MFLCGNPLRICPCPTFRHVLLPFLWFCFPNKSLNAQLLFVSLLSWIVALKDTEYLSPVKQWVWVKLNNTSWCRQDSWAENSEDPFSCHPVEYLRQLWMGSSRDPTAELLLPLKRNAWGQPYSWGVTYLGVDTMQAEFRSQMPRGIWEMAGVPIWGPWEERRSYTESAAQGRGRHWPKLAN